MHDGSAADYTPRPRSSGNDNVTGTPDQSSVIYHGKDNRQDESLLSDRDGDLTGSTPRPPTTKSLRPQFAALSSPYETLRRDYNKSGSNIPRQQRGTAAEDEEEDTELLFQQHTARLPDMSMTPRASLEPGDLQQHGGEEDDDTDFGGKGKNKDPLLHRMLDKNYRVMATPHKGISPMRWKIDKLATPGKGKEKQQQQPRPIWEDSPTSSPEMAVPQLRSAAFMSPVRAAYRGKAAAAAAASVTAPRTPGVSVQTPATGRKTKDVFVGKGAGENKYADEITWESDSEDAFGSMSPPKTIQFALPPSKLMQTPGGFLGGSDSRPGVMLTWNSP